MKPMGGNFGPSACGRHRRLPQSHQRAGARFASDYRRYRTAPGSVFRDGPSFLAEPANGVRPAGCRAYPSRKDHSSNPSFSSRCCLIRLAVAGNCWRDRGVRQTNWPAIRLQGTGSTSPLVVGRPRRNGSSPVTLLMHDLISHKVKHVIPGPRSGTRNPATRVDYNLDTRVCLGVVLTG